MLNQTGVGPTLERCCHGVVFSSRSWDSSCFRKHSDSDATTRSEFHHFPDFQALPCLGVTKRSLNWELLGISIQGPHPEEITGGSVPSERVRFDVPGTPTAVSGRGAICPRCSRRGRGLVTRVFPFGVGSRRGSRHFCWVQFGPGLFWTDFF